MDKEFKGDIPEFMGKTLNEIPAMQHGQCYECKKDPACEEQRGNGRMFWPHIQVNTLRKVDENTSQEELDLYRGLEGFSRF